MKHIPILLCLLTTAAISSCSKTDINTQNNTTSPAVVAPTAAPTAPIDSTASYTVTVTGTWKNPEHTIPNNYHFTQFIGLVHSKNAGFYTYGNLASKGVEDVAEVGNSVVLKNEMNVLVEAGNAIAPFYITIQGITGSASTSLVANIKSSYITFESMIAPSPDWFAGIDNYNLIQNGKWVTDITVPVFGYDAGTEDGDVFGYNNPATTPQQPISLMTPANASVIANGNVSIAPFATVRFVKQ